MMPRARILQVSKLDLPSKRKHFMKNLSSFSPREVTLCSPLPQQWLCSRQGSCSDLRISTGSPAGLGRWWSGVPNAGGHWMQRSGRALRPQGAGAPWVSSEALALLALSHSSVPADLPRRSPLPLIPRAELPVRVGVLSPQCGPAPGLRFPLDSPG